MCNVILFLQYHTAIWQNIIDQHDRRIAICIMFSWNYIESNLSGSNIFGTIEICSRYGKFEPLKVDHTQSAFYVNLYRAVIGPSG